MNTEITVALLACCGTTFGSILGIMMANRLSNYRIKKLEEKVDKHNNFASRLPVVEEQIKVMNHRLSDLEKGA
ncbi:MAG: hypothetical protein WAX04_03710 [Oscillospiraceae bacterium]